MARTPHRDRLTEARRIKTTDAAGNRIRLDQQPLVAYKLRCGHLGRDYLIVKNDLVFCEPCQATQRVTTILAQ